MRRSYLYLSMFFLLGLNSCQENSEISCLPQRVKSTLLSGNSITQDFKYENSRLDRIIRSDFQTDYYTFGQDGHVEKISRINVQFYRKNESRYIYENNRIARTEEYLMNLDRATQQDLDTAKVGINEYTWEGEEVSMIEKFTGSSDEGFNLDSYSEFSYDVSGNMIQKVTFDLQGDTTEAFSYVYDLQPHPFSSLDLPFDGSSMVNNVVQSEDLLTGEEFTHQVVYGPTLFPDQVIIKSQGVNNEVIQYTYDCQ